MLLHYVIIHTQYCSKERLVSIVKLFGDAWSSLAAVVETGDVCILLDINVDDSV